MRRGLMCVIKTSTSEAAAPLQFILEKTKQKKTPKAFIVMFFNDRPGLEDQGTSIFGI